MKHLHAALLLSSLALAGPLGSQSSATKTEADLAFALGLAERFKYVDLAEGVLAEVDARGVSGEERAALDLARCKVYGGVARREANPEVREDLFAKSLEAYRTFLDRHPYADNITAARREYVDLVNAYGHVLESQAEDQVGEEAEATREKIRTELERGLELTGDLIGSIAADAGEVEKQAKHRLMLSRGQMLLTLAKVSAEPTFYFATAEQTLEDLALAAGDTSVAGLQAYLLLGEVKVAQEQYLEARDFMEFVADIAVPSSAGARSDIGWGDLPAEVKQQRFKMLELGMAPLVNACIASGEAPSGVGWGLHMYNVRNADGLTFSPRGDLALLSLARALLSAGGHIGGSLNQGDLRWFPSEEDMAAAGFRGRRNTRSAIDLALGLAQEVNDRNRGNTLQIRAQAVISEITDRPGVVVSPAVLFEAAQGKYYSRDYDDAVTAFLEIRDRLDTQDEATRKEYGARTLHFLANAYNRMGRKLEAGLTFREAIKRFEGDPEYDPKNASGYLSMMKELRSTSGQAPQFVDLVKDAENEVIAHQLADADPGKILIDQGDRRYSTEDFEQARAKYLEVDSGSKYYEKALTKAALTLYKQGRFDDARAEFEAYVDEYVTDAANQVTDDVRQAMRREARAMATFYIGRIAFDKDSDFDEAIRRFTDYHERFPSQDSYGPIALYKLLEAHLAKDQFAEARTVLDQMIETFKSHSLTGRGAYKVYQQVKLAAGDSPSRDQLVELATLLGIYNSLSAPSFANWRAESNLWLDAEEWTQAEAVLRRMQTTFTEGEDAANVTQFVLPDLGKVLLELGQIPAAFAVLDPLVPDPDSDQKASLVTVQLWCRSVTGWLEGSATNIVEVPGVGGAENLAKASSYWDKLISAEERNDNWTCPWYELKLMRAYNFYQWSRVDSQQATYGLRLIEDLINVGFGGDRDMTLIGEACGDTLRRRFTWLLSKLT
ncbi:MAG: tetratricopeptide repeat protein [Planctomycetota bacterium]